MRQNMQTAPYPEVLEELVAKCSYRAHEGWTVRLTDVERDREGGNGEVIGQGLTLVITTKGYDSYRPERGTTYRVHHYFIVPAATYNGEVQGS